MLTCCGCVCCQLRKICEKLVSLKHDRILVWTWLYWTLLSYCCWVFNPLTPNDHYSNHTTLPTSKRRILYIYSTNIGTEYFKHGIYSLLFFSSKCSLFHNSNIFGSFIIHILYTGLLKLKKNNSGAKRLNVVVKLLTCQDQTNSFTCG